MSKNRLHHPQELMPDVQRNYKVTLNQSHQFHIVYCQPVLNSCAHKNHAEQYQYLVGMATNI